MKLYRSVIIFILFFFLLAACSIKPNNINDAMDEAGIKYDQIYRYEDVDAEKLSLVFYGINSQIGVGLVQKDHNTWKWVIGSTIHKKKEDVTLSYLNLDKRVPFLCGIVTNSTIHQLIAEYSVDSETVKKQAEFIELSDKERIWFIKLDKPQRPPIKLTGYKENGDMEWTSN
ncbi:hypothetical protein [Gorillibacterium sp. sgz500922]|uniref:hypothetical protein n=1 Tax=Gorillibacterium sp. sgz500922 TaxID=3446694 RepID=UPI003F6794EE